MPTIAIIGGTGPEGRGLGLRFAMAGHAVILGSRDAGRAAEAAQGLLGVREGLPITGAVNAGAAHDADWVVLSVPYDGLSDTVTSLAPELGSKMVVSVVAPLAFEGGQPRAVLVPDGSAAELVQRLLPGSTVTSAFHNLSARELLEPEREIESDVLVCADDSDARKQTMELAGAVKSLRGVDGGPLANSRTPEELTAMILHLNRTYKARATIKLLGI